MENAEIARIFHEIADLLEIEGGNPFRVRSYRNAAMAIEGLPEPIKGIVMADESRLDGIPGIGKSIHEKVVEIIETGKCAYHEDLLRELPPGLLDMLRLQGIGPKKVQMIYKSLGVGDIEGLEEAVKAHRLKGLPGIGEKTEANILKAIEEVKSRRGRFRLHLARSYALSIMEHLNGIPGITHIVYAGSLRRWREDIGDVDILAACEECSGIMDCFIRYPEVKEVLARGETKSSVVLRNGLQVDLRVLPVECFGAALQYFTGSKAHNIAVRDRAKKIGLKVSEYGVFSEKNGRRIAGDTEEGVYKAVGLPWIPPELRENQGEIEAALNGGLPELVDMEDIRGDLHVHTKDSDGSYSVEDMAAAAMDRGYDYIAITDHSSAIGVVHGMDELKLSRQMEHIDRINAGFELRGLAFRILKGIEVDIMSDGSLDMDTTLLKRLDVVVAAVHSRFNMSSEEMTERIIKAISTGVVDIIAHPTGRLIGAREPYPVDMKSVMKAARANNVAMELNSYPDRLDLKDSHLRLAKEMGVMVAISTDSHSKLHYDNIVFGVHTARRGWIGKTEVLNTRSIEDLPGLLKRG